MANPMPVAVREYAGLPEVTPRPGEEKTVTSSMKSFRPNVRVRSMSKASVALAYVALMLAAPSDGKHATAIRVPPSS
ncbi:hypothetical protein ZHAS_00013021 [Anopheles sinensis]|uniref:Uncharacterized protein n=1 Tax=Anopheles sinensis TaxID=74873 RepID=A0A084W4F7_ANOSI|nr:hypothetical protein ZHAS_00013021 [Anopheles sinensis]